MLRKKQYIAGVLALIMICILFVCARMGSGNREKEYKALFFRHMKVFTPEVPASASFAGEEVPMEIYYVREAFEREIIANTFMHSSTLLMFKRANRWFPVIEPILKKNGIPDDFKFLALAESNLANVVSPAGAEGFWQFVKPTGQKYGLEINEQVDERYHIEKATQAACDYFKESKLKFNKWTLVAASYNRGMDGLDRALDKQGVSDYYDLYLNDETSRYIFRIIAMKEVYKNPVRYGFYLREQEFYPQIPVRLIAVDSAISDLPAFAKRMSVNYRILRELNPWIQNYTLPNKARKTYLFKLPNAGALDYEALVKNIPSRDAFFHDTLKINEVH